MDDVIEFLEKFTRLEYEAQRAWLTERDDKKYYAARKAYAALLGPGLLSDYSRPSNCHSHGLRNMLEKRPRRCRGNPS